MDRFSERIGAKPPKTVVQVNSMDSDLRNSLWNALHIQYLDGLRAYVYETRDLKVILKTVWIHYLKRPIDEFEDVSSDLVKVLKDYFFAAEWYEVYDVIEFLANTNRNQNRTTNFINACNYFLAKELSAFRFVGSTLTRITDQIEMSEIEAALETPVDAAKTQIQTALSLMSDRKKPDYRNSIKESIGAVESLSRSICGDKDASLGEAIKAIEKQGKLTWHPSFKSALGKLYGYTSDESGVRHGLKDSDNIDFEEAKFMLVVSAAFVNYLVVEAGKATIVLR